MIFYDTYTSRRLEGYARARGLHYGIAFTPGNNGGRYHVIAMDGEPCSSWHGLGWTRAESEDTIDLDALVAVAQEDVRLAHTPTTES